MSFFGAFDSQIARVSRATVGRLAQARITQTQGQQASNIAAVTKDNGDGSINVVDINGQTSTSLLGFRVLQAGTPVTNAGLRSF